MGRQLAMDLDALESEARHKTDVANDIHEHADLYKAITADVEAWPYGAKTAPVDKWVWDHTVYPLEELQLEDDETIAGVVRFKAIQDKVADDFKKVVEAMTMGAMQPHEGGMFATDYMGFADIGPFALGCSARATIEVGWADPEKVIPDVEPWHAWSAVDPTNEYWDTTIEVEGKKFGVKHWGRMSWHDFYTVLRNICAAGYERQVREVLGQETKAQREAKEAAELEVKAAVIDYGKITGIQTSYTLASNAMDDLLACAVAGQGKETHLHYEPTGSTWGPTMDVYLPKEHLQKWQAMAGSNPIQLKRLRGIIFTMLLQQGPPLWWKTQRQVTLTLGQIERAYWNDPKHKTTEAERDLMVSSLSLLVNTRFESKYPNKDRAKRHEHIDMNSLIHEGITLLPAQFVRGVDARGHVVDAENAALQFYALPPLDMDAEELKQAYNVPYLNGAKEGLKALGRVRTNTYDVETELAKYVRMAVENGRATGYVEEVARITNANEYKELEEIIDTVVIAAKYRGADPKEMAEAVALRKQAQLRLRKIRMRVKKDIQQVLPVLISNERLKKHYLTVTTTSNRRGFEIRRVKPRRDQKTKKLIEPPYVCEF